jgi:hypothetical protein
MPRISAAGWGEGVAGAIGVGAAALANSGIPDIAQGAAVAEAVAAAVAGARKGK